MSEVVLVVGIQGSGKSTAVQPYLDKGYARLNRDEQGGSMASLVAQVMGILTVQKRSIVADNTFCTAADRKLFIETAKKCGATVKAVVMNTKIEDAQYNVCQRMIRKHGKLLGPDDFKKIKDPNVFPPAVLFKYRNNYEAPRTDEGFDAIEFVEFKRLPNAGYTNKAIILDKDGTLTECVGGNGKFPCNVSEIRELKGRKERLQEWKDKGYHLLGVSNQSGVAKGDVTLMELVRIFNKTNELIGHNIDWNYCPHRIPPIGCYCRKPMPGLGVQFIEQYKLDPSQTIMVGDMTTDKTFASRCGFQYVDANKFFG